MTICRPDAAFSTGLSGIGAAALLAHAVSGGGRTASRRQLCGCRKDPGICVAPQYVVEELLRAEGFTDIRYVPFPPGAIHAGRRSRMAASISH